MPKIQIPNPPKNQKSISKIHSKHHTSKPNSKHHNQIKTLNKKNWKIQNIKNPKLIKKKKHLVRLKVLFFFGLFLWVSGASSYSYPFGTSLWSFFFWCFYFLWYGLCEGCKSRCVIFYFLTSKFCKWIESSFNFCPRKSMCDWSKNFIKKR